MKCPSCGGAGFFVMRLQVGIGPRVGTSMTTGCGRCSGSRWLSTCGGVPGDDGEFPLGWSPLAVELFPAWSKDARDGFDPDGGYNQ